MTIIDRLAEIRERADKATDWRLWVTCNCPIEGREQWDCNSCRKRKAPLVDVPKLCDVAEEFLAAFASQFNGDESDPQWVQDVLAAAMDKLK